MTRGAERPYYPEIATLVRKEPHSLSPLQDERFFMSNRVRGIDDGRLNVL
jgi:hypothetical protein